MRKFFGVYNSNVVWILLCLLPLALFYRPIVASEFFLTNDHEAYGFAKQELAIGSVVVNDAVNAGRFRPFYWVFRYGQFLLCGINPQCWHVSTIIMFCVTLCLFFFLLRAFYIQSWVALLGTWFAMYSLASVDAWIILGNQEAIGMPLLLCCMLLIRANKTKSLIVEMVLFISATCTALSKESFTLCLIGLFAYRTLSLGVTSKLLKKVIYDRVCISLLVVFLLATTGIATSVLTAGGTSNGGSVFNLYATGNTAFIRYAFAYLNNIQTVLLIPMLLVGACFIFLYRLFTTPNTSIVRIKKQEIIGFIICCLVILFQIFLYAGRSYQSYRYAIPSSFILIFIIFYFINVLVVRVGNRLSYVTFVLYATVFFFQMLPSTLQYAYAYLVSTQSINTLRRSLLETLPKGGSIVLIGHPSYHYEQLYALKVFLETDNNLYDIYMMPSNTVWEKNVGQNNFEFDGLDAGAQFFENKVVSDFHALQAPLAVLSLQDDTVGEEMGSIESFYANYLRIIPIAIYKTKGDDISNFFQLNIDNGWPLQSAFVAK